MRECSALSDREAMAKQDKQASRPKRRGRTTLLAGLLAVVGVLAAWLSNCISGFGIGSSGDAEGEAEQAVESEQATPAEPEAQPSESEQAGENVRKPMPLKLTIDARGCIFDGGQPIDCATVCEREELWEGADSVIIDAQNGPHGVVMEVLDCLKTKQLAVSIKRK